MTAGFDCLSDMSFFWAMQTEGSFCIGIGYQHKPEMCTGHSSNTDKSITRITRTTNTLFSAVSMTGLFSEATFNWGELFLFR